MSGKRKMLPVLGQEIGAAEPVVDAPSGNGDSSDLDRTVLRVGGMDCASCAATVEKSVARIPGVRRATVNFAIGRLDAEHGSEVGSERIEKAVEAAGYTVERSGQAEQGSFWKTPRTLSVVASAALFVLGMTLGVTAAPDILRVGTYLSAIVVGGLPIFRSALVGIRSLHLDMNVLMSLAVIGGVAIGEWAESASVVVLFAVGNALQVYAVDRTRGAVQALARLAPDEVVIKNGDIEERIAVERVVVGDVMVVKPGERIALDGQVAEGRTTVDESPVTGESVPVEKSVGGEVYSGSLNGSGALLVRVTKAAADSTLQRITRMVEEAQATKAPFEVLVDRFSRVYTPVVVGVAGILAVVPPLLGGDFGEWFYRALALLIIACPCALVISTPVTVVSGIGAASRLGILIKGGAALEGAGRLKALALDKTGTLTEGRPVVSSIAVLTGSEDEAMKIAAALERRSEHPLAYAILSAADGLELPQVSGFESVAGRGAEGRINGGKFLIGSPSFFGERGVSLTGASDALGEVEEAGETPVILGDETRAIAVFGLADKVRDDAPAAIQSLKNSGIEEIVMLTGDAEAPARRVATELGISYRAGLLPEQKVEAIGDLVRRYGEVGMVGDGVNDAPALATATVGFAMGAAGSDVALETADVALMKDDLSKLARSVALSRSAERIIRQNVIVSLAIKGVFVLLAPFGLVALWLAVLADMGTSIAVTANGLRLFGRNRTGASR
ncbi:heavy metal translocating P-type ATPase [Rubrobacter radiotolerans]|uniref:Cation-translocating P-type ATPase n=1 Tax=Rubrobacter radiotolerans TaxID=42256 RepID=A0AB35T874_RUBRA|nr:cation-translocating P-type ATPase [Rubrobacter radiotolerans]MDX5895152.1 cation-translocating P-type ATPase [Rubrobacter radiotolerans]